MTPFDDQYPNIARWVQDGWIELGQDEYSRSFIRVLHIGGRIWQGKESYESAADALADADTAVAQAANELDFWWEPAPF
jgi:hypothetical protein